jgi:hypothetical protein
MLPPESRSDAPHEPSSKQRIGSCMSTPVHENLDGPLAYAPPKLRQAGTVQQSEPPYFVLIEGKQRGPLSRGDVLSMALARVILADTLVWREGWQNWRPARSIDWLETGLPERPDQGAEVLPQRGPPAQDANDGGP